MIRSVPVEAQNCISCGQDSVEVNSFYNWFVDTATMHPNSIVITPNGNGTIDSIELSLIDTLWVSDQSTGDTVTVNALGNDAKYVVTTSVYTLTDLDCSFSPSLGSTECTVGGFHVKKSAEIQGLAFSIPLPPQALPVCLKTCVSEYNQYNFHRNGLLSPSNPILVYGASNANIGNITLDDIITYIQGTKEHTVMTIMSGDSVKVYKDSFELQLPDLAEWNDIDTTVTYNTCKKVIPQPITLESFEVYSHTHYLEPTWTFTMIERTQRISLMRSLNGVGWDRIYTVMDAEDGNNQPGVRVSGRYIDVPPQPGIWYYYLLEEYIDGNGNWQTEHFPADSGLYTGKEWVSLPNSNPYTIAFPNNTFRVIDSSGKLLADDVNQYKFTHSGLYYVYFYNPESNELGEVREIIIPGK